MATLDDAAVEAEARALLRETITRSGWFPGLSAKERRKRIERDIEQYWPVMVREAARRLIDRFAAAARDGNARLTTI